MKRTSTTTKSLLPPGNCSLKSEMVNKSINNIYIGCLLVTSARSKAPIKGTENKKKHQRLGWPCSFQSIWADRTLLGGKFDKVWTKLRRKPSEGLRTDGCGKSEDPMQEHSWMGDATNKSSWSGRRMRRGQTTQSLGYHGETVNGKLGEEPSPGLTRFEKVPSKQGRWKLQDQWGGWL